MHPFSASLLETCVSLLGAIGVCIYMRVLLMQESRTLLEKRILFFLCCTGFLLIVRGPFWLWHSDLFGILTFIPATLIPISSFLIVEALLRRHMPFLSKAVISAGSLLYLVLALMGRMHSDPYVLGSYAIFATIIGSIIASVVLTRDRAALTAIENGMVDANMVAITIGLPLILTDLLGDMGLVVPRLGTMFILMMVYTFSRLTTKGDTKRIIFIELSLTLGLGALIAATNWVFFLPGMGVITLMRSFSLFSCLILTFMIGRRAKLLCVQSRDSTLVSALASSDTHSMSRFISSIQHLPAVAGLEFIREEQMPHYDASSIQRFFTSGKKDVVSLSGLRKQSKSSQNTEPEGMEQLIDLLERRRMTHACLIGDQPLTLLLVDAPQAGYETAVGVEVGLVRKMAKLIEQGGNYA